MALATTFLADLTGCRNLPGRAADIRPWIEEAIRAAEMDVVSQTNLDFPGAVWGDKYGASCLALIVPLNESGIMLHTWPELDSRALIDFTTCGPAEKAATALLVLVEHFDARKVVIHPVCTRGADE